MVVSGAGCCCCCSTSDSPGAVGVVGVGAGAAAGGGVGIASICSGTEGLSSSSESSAGNKERMLKHSELTAANKGEREFLKVQCHQLQNRRRMLESSELSAGKNFWEKKVFFSYNKENGAENYEIYNWSLWSPKIMKFPFSLIYNSFEAQTAFSSDPALLTSLMLQQNIYLTQGHHTFYHCVLIIA